MASKRLHVLGGGVWQVPTIQLAKELGHTVLVTDVYEERPGYAFADAHEVIDIRNLERTLDATRRFRADGILCDTTDVGVTTAAYVAEKLGLPGMGYATALRFTNKFLMREASTAAGVLNPRYALAQTAEEARAAAARVGYPLAVKPADSQSSRGVSQVTGAESLDAAFEHALANTQTGQVLLEEWIVGTEVTVEGMAYAGVPYALAISEKDHYANLPQVASRLVYPPGFDDALIRAIEEANANTVRALGLDTGVTHAEYIVTRQRKVYLVEIAARGGGSRLYSHIVPHVSGIDLPRYYMQYCLGDSQTWPQPSQRRRAAVLEFFTFASGTVRSISGVEQAAKLPGVADVAVELREGDVFSGATDDRTRPGYVVALADTREEAIAAAAAARDLVRVEVA